MAKELDKVIRIGNEDYNVNAVEADHVKAALTLNKVQLSDKGETNPSVTSLKFDGSASKALNLVTADGGRFRGRIKVPNNTNSSIDNEAVLNYHDVKNVILANIKNNAIVYNWNGSTVNAAFKDHAINSISIVQGSEANVNSFASYNNALYTQNADHLPTYLYIGTNENKVYYGTADSTEAKLLAINNASKVAEAAKLATAQEFSVDLATDSIVSFDGTQKVALGVNGILPLEKGGLGGDISTSSQAAKTAEYYINGSIEENNTSEITDDTYMVFRNSSPSSTTGQYCRKKALKLWDYLVGKIRGTFGFSNDTNNVLSIAHGGTGATTKENIEAGKATNAEKIQTTLTTASGTTQNFANITISNTTPGPSDGKQGDIWIVYSNT